MHRQSQPTPPAAQHQPPQTDQRRPCSTRRSPRTESLTEEEQAGALTRTVSQLSRELVQLALQRWQQTASDGRQPTLLWSGRLETGHTDILHTATAAGRDPAAQPQHMVPRQTVAMLTLGFPWAGLQDSADWLGRRLIWWPTGVPPLRRVGIVSSRLGRRLDKHLRWFDLLRTAVVRVDPAAECLCVATGTAVAAAVIQAAQLLGRPLLTLQTDASPAADASSDADRPSATGARSAARVLATAERWLCDCLTALAAVRSASPEQASAWDAYVSPELPGGADSHSDAAAAQRATAGTCLARPTTASQPGTPDRQPCSAADEIDRRWPLADRLQTAAAERLYVLHCVPGGNTEQLLVQRLARSTVEDLRVYVAEDCRSPAVQAAGQQPSPIIRWLVRPAAQSTVTAAQQPATLITAAPADAATAATGAPVIQQSPGRGTQWTSAATPWDCPDEWLLHWTRARPGPWPGQSHTEWLQELILGSPTADHSALAALLRITDEGCLRASALGIRGGYAVISFTAVPLPAFRRRHVFRRHRQRYDFEPWGLAIRRRALQDRGARPVIYGDEACWQALPDAMRPWFQKRTHGPGPTNNLAEEEWRIIGDLPLQTLGSEDLFYFVDHAEAAAVLSRRTTAPILVVPPPSGA